MRCKKITLEEKKTHTRIFTRDVMQNYNKLHLDTRCEQLAMFSTHHINKSESL